MVKHFNISLYVKDGLEMLNLIVKYALYRTARHRAPMACSSRSSADCASITTASFISSETFVLEGHCVDRGVCVARYFSLDLSWKHHISSTSGRGSLGMLCIAGCVLNETPVRYLGIPERMSNLIVLLKGALQQLLLLFQNRTRLRSRPLRSCRSMARNLLAAVRLREYYLNDVLMVA